VDAYVYLDVECSQSDVVRLAAAKVNVTEVEGVQVALRRFCSRLCAAKVSKVTTEITTLKDNTGNVNATLCGAIAGSCQGSLNRVLTKAGFPIAYADQNAAVESAESDDNSSNMNVPIIAGKGMAGCWQENANVSKVRSTAFTLLIPLSVPLFPCNHPSKTASVPPPLSSGVIVGVILLIIGAVLIARFTRTFKHKLAEEEAILRSQKLEQDAAITISAGNPVAIASLGFTPRHLYNEDLSTTSSRPPSVIHAVQDTFLRPPSVHSVPSRPGSATDFFRPASPAFLLRPPV